MDENIKLCAVQLLGSENNKYCVTLKVTEVNRDGVLAATAG